MDGRSLPQGDQPGQVEISGSDPVRVEWHLQPTSNSRHTFTLTYQLLGVVRQTDGADLLIYQPLPDEFESTIAQSTVMTAMSMKLCIMVPRTFFLRTSPP